MAAVQFCSVNRDQDHLVEGPLQQAQVSFRLDQSGEQTVVLIAEADIDRARAALERVGTFRGVDA